MIKKLSLVLLLGLLVGCSKVPAGHVGVKVHLLGTSKGVDTEELNVGRYWIGWNEELYLFPTFKQNYVWTKDAREGSSNDESFTFQTKEGMEVGADIGVTYKLDPKKINTIFQKYRKGVEEITDIFLRNYVRDSLNSVASNMAVESVYGSGKTKLMEDVQKKVSNQVSEEGIIIEKIYLLGSFRLPKIVITALNAKVKATQQAQQRENELREAEAEAKKKIAEAEGTARSIIVKADAQAKANRKIAGSLSSALVEYKKIEKWNGVLPKVSGSKSMIMLKEK